MAARVRGARVRARRARVAAVRAVPRARRSRPRGAPALRAGARRRRPAAAALRLPPARRAGGRALDRPRRAAARGAGRPVRCSCWPSSALSLGLARALLARAGSRLAPAAALFLALALFFVAPLPKWWRPESLYLGQLSPTVWHNPTVIAALPLAVASFWAFLLPVPRRARDECVAGALIGLSVLAKPNFALAFLPAAGLLRLLAARSARAAAGRARLALGPGRAGARLAVPAGDRHRSRGAGRRCPRRAAARGVAGVLAAPARLGARLARLPARRGRPRRSARPARPCPRRRVAARARGRRAVRPARRARAPARRRQLLLGRRAGGLPALPRLGLRAARPRRRAGGRWRRLAREPRAPVSPAGRSSPCTWRAGSGCTCGRSRSRSRTDCCFCVAAGDPIR